jgi:hypothetical protein
MTKSHTPVHAKINSGGVAGRCLSLATGSLCRPAIVHETEGINHPAAGILFDPDFAEPILHMGEVTLRRADFLQFRGVDVLHDLCFLAEGLKQR